MRIIIRSLLAITALTLSSFANAAPIYFSDFNTLYAADSSDGLASTVGDYTISHSSFDIALDSSGDIYSISNKGELYKVNAADASTTLIGSSGTFINGLAFDNFGNLYGSGGSQLYTLDLLTGAATLVGSTGFGSAGDIIFDAANNLFLASTSDELVSVNPFTGAGVSVGAFGISGMFGLVSVGNDLYGGSSSGDYYSIDSNTGAASFINNIGTPSNFVAGMASAPSAIPTPATLSLFVLGLLSLRYRRATR